MIAFANLETNSDDTRAKYTEFIEALKTKNTHDCLETIGVNFDRKADIPNLLNNFSKYVEKVDRWKTAKVLDFLGNFLKNHQGTVNDNDLFKPITDLTEDCDWEKKIKENK